VLTRDFATAAILSEELGQDEFTDYLSIGFSSNEYIGELFGPTAMEMQDAMAMVHQVLQRLPLKQKEVIQLRDIEGYSYQEIAEMTGYGLNDVKISIHRARNKIKEELTKAFDYGLEKSRSAS